MSEPVAQPVDRVLLQRLDPGLPVPSYAHAHDAGADLVARADHVLSAGGGRALVDTGMAIALPAGYVGFVTPRSGLAARHGITVLNGPGTVDAGYRGELRVTMINTDPHTDFVVRRGDRIAQLVVQRVSHVLFEEVSELPSSARGTGGHGSTGGFASAQNERSSAPDPRGAEET